MDFLSLLVNNFNSCFYGCILPISVKYLSKNVENYKDKILTILLWRMPWLITLNHLWIKSNKLLINLLRGIHHPMRAMKNIEEWIKWIPEDNLLINTSTQPLNINMDKSITSNKENPNKKLMSKSKSTSENIWFFINLLVHSYYICSKNNLNFFKILFYFRKINKQGRRKNCIFNEFVRFHFLGNKRFFFLPVISISSKFLIGEHN